MKITLKRPYRSIGALSCPELPNFVVLTGRNGAGKTQILQAIRNGSAAVSGVSKKQVELYDLSSFRPPDNTLANWQSSQFARETAGNYLEGEHEPSPKSVASKIFKRHATEAGERGGKMGRKKFEGELRKRIGSTPDFKVFGENAKRGSAYDRELHSNVFDPLISRAQGSSASRRSIANSFNDNPGALLTMAMKRTGNLAHELTYDDIIRASHYEGRPIENSVSQVFTAYKVDQYDWAHSRFEAADGPVSYPELIAEYQRRNPPPWDTLRNVLSEMREAAGDGGLFDFDFSDPADLRLDMSNYQEFSFKSDMTNRTSSARYELNSLSSGEKILMALCLASFNQRLGKRRPKLLLLDELDTVLHPSMVAALVAALRSLFVDHDCGILMTTHSPMTVAALPETDVFQVVRKREEVSLTPTTTTLAVEELSEGIATVDAGLRIAASHEADITLLTEGNNTLHLKRWVELNFPSRVHVFEGLPEHRDKGQLLSYGRMLAAMNPESHFVIVWDCDAAGQAQKLRQDLPQGARVTPFAFDQRDNDIARRGIENNYDESILSPFAITKLDSEGRELSREFPKNRKTKFANHVRHNATKEYFANFGALRSVITGVLDNIDAAPCRPTSE